MKGLRALAILAGLTLGGACVDLTKPPELREFGKGGAGGAGTVPVPDGTGGETSLGTGGGGVTGGIGAGGAPGLGGITGPGGSTVVAGAGGSDAATVPDVSGGGGVIGPEVGTEPDVAAGGTIGTGGVTFRGTGGTGAAGFDAATGTGGVVTTGGEVGTGGSTGAGGTVATGGGTVATGGSTVATGGVVGTGGKVATGGVVGTGGAGTGGAATGGTGTGGVTATGGSTSSGYHCGAAAIPPANVSSGGVTDFTDWNATTARWGSPSGLNGTIYTYFGGGATVGAAKVEGTPAGLHLTGSVPTSGYAGGGMTFLSCVTVASFTKVQFDVYSAASACPVELQLQTFDQRPTDQSPPGGCLKTDAGSGCFTFPVASKVVSLSSAIAAPGSTVSVTLANMTNWSSSSATQIVGIQWQFTGTSGSTCSVDATFTKIKFVP